jgi:hypothetical protein
MGLSYPPAEYLTDSTLLTMPPTPVRHEWRGTDLASYPF